MPLRVISRRTRERAATAAAPVQRASAPPPFGLPEPPAGWPQKPAGISLCMIVKNEERFLAQALESVKDFVDEICIVDTGSTDRTIEIARGYGARIEEHAWRNDFGWARNKALAMATRRWVFQLDADEELLPESHEGMRVMRNAPAHRVGVWIRCNNAADDYAGTGSMSHALVRIFPNDSELCYKGAVHEFVSIDDSPIGIPAVHSPIAILHHGYLNAVVAERNKAQRNLDIIRAQIEAEPHDPFHWFNLGMTAYLMRNDEASREGFEKMREINGDAPRGFIPNGLATLADLYTERLGAPEKGREIAELCLHYSPHYANGHFALGKALVGLREFDLARAAFAEAIEDGKYRHLQFVVDDEVPIWKAQCEIAATYVQQGDDVAAIEWFDRGLANRPAAQPLRVNKAKALERLGRIDEAGDVLSALFADFPNEQAALHYVNYLLRHGKEQLAVQTAEAASKTLPKRVAVSMLVACAAVAQKNHWPEPERYLERAVEIDPGASEALNPLEAFYREAGDEAGIRRLLEAEKAVAPETPADHLRRAYRGIATGAFEEGLDAALRGLEGAPHDAMLRYNAAICSVNLGKREEALVHLDAIDRTNAEVYVKASYLRAVVLRGLGRDEDALQACEDALAVEPAQADALALRKAIAVGLASRYLEEGRVDDARRMADRAMH